VSRSHWPSPFHRYSVPMLPPTPDAPGKSGSEEDARLRLLHDPSRRATIRVRRQTSAATGDEALRSLWPRPAAGRGGIPRIALPSVVPGQCLVHGRQSVPNRHGLSRLYVVTGANLPMRGNGRGVSMLRGGSPAPLAPAVALLPAPPLRRRPHAIGGRGGTFTGFAGIAVRQHRSDAGAIPMVTRRPSGCLKIRVTPFRLARENPSRWSAVIIRRAVSPRSRV
jgi:hypothetical protein